MDTPDSQQRRYYLTPKGKCRSCKKRKARSGKALCNKCSKRKLDWYYANREKAQKDAAARRLRLKLEAYAAYGGAKCACCGEHHIEFLSIDHIKKNGAEHRRALGYSRGGCAFYNWLKMNHYPSGYQVLCMNCNFASGIHGTCPHQREKRSAA